MLAQVFDGTAQCLHSMGQYDDAIVFFSDAIEKDMQFKELKEPNNV
jgi:hypothetical protein